MDLLLTAQRSEPRGVVICGELDMGTVAPIRSCVAPLLEEPGPVRLNMAGVTFMDCSILGLLVALSHQAEATGGRLRVTGLQRCPRNLVRMFDLEEAFGMAGPDDDVHLTPRGGTLRGGGDEEVDR
ncbi:hypothetical protein NUM3379_22580 [Kineococcus sp. NUM-3379]